MLALTALLLPVTVVAGSAHAQTFTLLYSFTGNADGGAPIGGLIIGAQGNLYGATAVGGNTGCVPYGCGTIFKLDPTGHETVLYSFTAKVGDGYFPGTTLVQDAQGNFYGTAAGGSSGYGIVFKVDSAGNETIVYGFTGAADGGYPTGLTIDAQGNLYGTTDWGGDLTCNAPHGCGTVFKLDNTGKETLLYSFTGVQGDGKNPVASLLRDAIGNLYGTTPAGGSLNGGTVFKVDTTGKETVLFSFDGTDGLDPHTGLVMDVQDNLYGATYSGGHGVDGGNGLVFKLNKGGKEIVLHRFAASGKAGYHPGTLVRDAQGNLYGTTIYGGAFGYGTVFKVDKTGKETVLYSFHGADDGAFPYAGLLLDGQGSLYGTTTGLFETTGTVFKLTP